MYTWYVYKVFCDDVSSVSQWNTRESSFILMFDADNLTIVCEIIAYVLHTAFFSVYIRICYLFCTPRPMAHVAWVFGIPGVDETSIRRRALISMYVEVVETSFDGLYSSQQVGTHMI